MDMLMTCVQTIDGYMEELRTLTSRSREASRGAFFPSGYDLTCGCAAFFGDLETDIVKWSEILRNRDDRSPGFAKIADLLEPYLLTRKPTDLVGLFDRVRKTTHWTYADELLRAAIVETAVSASDAEAVEYLVSACRSGVRRAWLEGWRGFGFGGPESFDEIGQLCRLEAGVAALASDGVEHILLQESMRRVDSDMPAPSADVRRSWIGDLSRSMDGPSSVTEAIADTATFPEGIVVLRKPLHKLTHEQARAWDGFEGIADVPMRPILAPDPSVFARLREEWPHAGSVIDRLVGDLTPGMPIRLRPTLLVGTSGSGKTSLLQALAAELGLSTFVFGCATSSDNSFGGTASRWATAGPSVPLELIRSSGVPNPFVLLDELDKAPSNDRHGSLSDGLLTMIEPATAHTYYEPGLNAPADLSFVNILATANALSVPMALRDRFRVLRMPDPRPEHLHGLCLSIVRSIGRERGDTTIVEALLPDEEEVVGRLWKGGSIRWLRRAVETTLALRDRMAVRQ